MKPTPALLAELAQKTVPTEWRGTCPACGYPCALSVRHRPGGKLQYYCFAGCSHAKLYEALHDIAGAQGQLQHQPNPRAKARLQACALRLWNEAQPLIGTIGEKYLDARCLPHLAASKALRFHPNVSHPQGGKLPAMIAQVVDVSGMPVAVHRTYLALDGLGKAAVEPPRAGLGPLSGGVVRLIEIQAGKPLVVGEGIETSASAGVCLNTPAWAALSAGNLAHNLELPPEATEVIIAVDPDDAGRKAASEAGRRWRQMGRRVQFAQPHGNGDFNDIHCRQG